MSTEGGEGKSNKKAASQSTSPTEGIAHHHHLSSEAGSSASAPAQQTQQQQLQQQQPTQLPESPPRLSEEGSQDVTETTTTSPATASQPQASKRDQPSTSTTPSTPEDTAAKPRQVIAVSASKGPAAFFNLARKFLVSDEMCDLSALEGAIVSAVDAAHLLERSKLATIVRVQTSYVAVEPKRRKSQQTTPTSGMSPVVESITPSAPAAEPMALVPPAAAVATSVGRGGPSQTGGAGGGSRERELRRARIVITVKRTESYKAWLEANPLQAIIAGDGGDDEEGGEEGAEEEEEAAAAAQRSRRR